jgi:hypothetical protein
MPRSPSSRNSGPPGGRKRCTFDGCRKLAPPRRKRCDEHKPGAAAPKDAAPGRTGCTEPRLFTPPLRPLTRKTSRGFEVADFARMIGEPLLPWQEWAAIHALELLPNGEYRFRTVLVLVARQSGKSSLKRTISLWRLYMDGAKLILGAAQDVSQAREQWNYCISTIRGCPDLAAELDTVRNVNGDEWFRVAGGGRYKITASNDKAGRGLSVDELNIDELRTQTDWKAWAALSATTRARPQAQTWAMSNMGGEEAVVLNNLRSVALAGTDPSIGIFEWSGPEGCELDDWDAICQANPGLGYTISERALQTAIAIEPPAIVRTEILCQKVDSIDGAIDLGAWRDCVDAGGTMDALRNRLAACFDVAKDGQHATLAVAARLGDGRVRLEVVAAWPSTDAARGELPRLLDRIRPNAIAWYPAGPAAALAPLLRGRKGSLELTGGKAGEACQGLADLAIARQVIHPGDPLLDAHVAAAQKLHSGDGWRFVRPDDGHVDAAYAAAGAVYAVLNMPAAKVPRIRMLA